MLSAWSNLRILKCSLDSAKRSCYRAADAVFGKICIVASDKVTLHLLRTFIKVL